MEVVGAVREFTNINIYYMQMGKHYLYINCRYEVHHEGHILQCIAK